MRREDVHTAVVRLQLSVFTFARKDTCIEICRERDATTAVEEENLNVRARS